MSERSVELWRPETVRVNNGGLGGVLITGIIDGYLRMLVTCARPRAPALEKRMLPLTPNPRTKIQKIENATV